MNHAHVRRSISHASNAAFVPSTKVSNLSLQCLVRRVAIAAMLGFTMLGAQPIFLHAVRAAVSVTAIQGLHVVGNQIENSAGAVVQLRGVNRSGTEYQCQHGYGIFDGPSDDASVQAMASWGINVVRVPLNEQCWLAINGVNAAYAGANYQQAIKGYVTLLNQHGLAAILDLHWNAPGTAQADAQAPLADQDHSGAFWTSVASAFKDNQSVIFDLYNEPYIDTYIDTNDHNNAATKTNYGDIWDCWLSGDKSDAGGNYCTAQTQSLPASAPPPTSPPTPFKILGMQGLVDAVRNTGATNVVLAGGLSYANNLTEWLSHEPHDPTGNLAASWHVYNRNRCKDTSCYDREIAPVLAKVPLIAGEIGEDDCGHTFIDTVMQWLDAHGGSYLGWAWNTADCATGPSLISSYDGTPTQFGTGLLHHLIPNDPRMPMSGGLILKTPLSLSSSSVSYGQSLTAQATIQNTSGVTITLKSLTIAGRPPGGTHGGGPYDDFGALSNPSLAPGASQTIQEARTFGSPDPNGSWYVYLTYQAQDGSYHDLGSDVSFTVNGSSTMPTSTSTGAPVMTTTPTPIPSNTSAPTAAPSQQVPTSTPAPTNTPGANSLSANGAAMGGNPSTGEDRLTVANTAPLTDLTITIVVQGPNLLNPRTGEDGFGNLTLTTKMNPDASETFTYALQPGATVPLGSHAIAARFDFANNGGTTHDYTKDTYIVKSGGTTVSGAFGSVSNTPAPTTPSASPNPTNTAIPSPTGTPVPPTSHPTATSTLVPTNTPGVSGLSASGAAMGGNPSTGEDRLTVANTAPLTDLTITIVVQGPNLLNPRTGEDGFGNLALTTQMNPDGSETFTYALQPGATVPSGSHAIAARFDFANSGGTTHDYTKDTYAVKSGGTTVSGTF